MDMIWLELAIETAFVSVSADVVLFDFDCHQTVLTT